MQQLIGNDIVDLTTSDALFKSQNQRFLKRVLGKDELTELKKHNNVKDQDIYLWSCWAAKEAVYKVVKKKMPEIIFSHSRFVIKNFNLLELIKKKYTHTYVQFQEDAYPIRLEISNDYIHCIALNFGDFSNKLKICWKVESNSKLESIDMLFSKEEEGSIYSTESRNVRKLAKTLLFQKGVKDAEVIRSTTAQRRLSPPKLFRNNDEIKGHDISLSHDGKYSSCGFILN